MLFWFSWQAHFVRMQKKKWGRVLPVPATSLCQWECEIKEKSSSSCLVLIFAAFWSCVESILSLNGFSTTVKSLINQLIGQHAWKGQLSVTVRSSREAVWQMSCLCGLSDWLAVSGAFSLSPILSPIVRFYISTRLVYYFSLSFPVQLTASSSPPPSLPPSPLHLWPCFCSWTTGASRWRSWSGCFVASPRAWSTCRTWTTSTETSPPGTSWSTAT